MAKHNALGSWGEDTAAEHLTKLGYAIVERNLKIGTYEIDIIATKGNIIAFVEVKTRSNDDDDPLEAIDRKRINRMARAADIYIRSREIEFEPQFDIIAINGTDRNNCKLVHYPDAFLPPLTTY